MGIDPGLTGGLCLINEQGKALIIKKIDLTKGADFSDFLRGLKSQADYESLKVGLELVSAMPGQGVTSMFTFGVGYGKLQGHLEAAALPFKLISPKSWQKFLPEADGGPKASVKKFCEFTWGLDNFMLKGCRVPHQGAMDAAVIAEYLRRLDLGLVEPPKPRAAKVRRQPIRLAI